MSSMATLKRATLASAVAAVCAGGQVGAAVLEEVVVTAQKREQSVQDVGISVSAFTGEQLQALGYTNAQQVTALAAGVSTVQPNGEANYSIAIRGSASSDFTSNNESPVAVYVDDVYISQMSGAGFMLFDMERVEILRGPQGTLFGRNATGGLAHYITVKPTQEFGGYGQFTVGEYDQVKFEGAVGGGLTDTVSGRVSVSTHHNSGYADNRFLNQDLNDANDWAGRVQLLFEPNEDVSFLLNARYSLQQIRTGFFEHQPAAVPGQLTPNGVPNPTLGYFDPDLGNDVFAGDYDREGFNDNETYGFTGTLNWQTDNFEIVSITDYSSVTRDYIEDSDASPVPFFNFYLNTDAEQFSQELRISGETDRLQWVTGFYYLNIDIADANGGESTVFHDAFACDATCSNAGTFINPGEPAPFTFGGARGLDSPYTIDTESWSLFGQLEYAFNEQWSGIVGFRWIEEDKDYSYRNNGVRFIDGQRHRNGNPNITVPFIAFDTSVSDSLWSAKVELDWRPTDDLLLFGSWNRGTKASGFNAPFIPLVTVLTGAATLEELIPYDPEELDAFEVGFKWSFADGLARLNGSVYYYDYSDYQAFNLVVLDAITTNRDAEMWGIDMELQASPMEGLDLLLGMAYNDAEIDLDGRTSRPVQSPKWNISGLVRYSWPMFGGTVAIQADADYRSKQLFSLTGLPTVEQDGYAVANARLSYRTQDDKWEAALFVNNLFDNEYRVQQFDLSGDFFDPVNPGVMGLVEEYYGRPRWIGGSVSYRF